MMIHAAKHYTIRIWIAAFAGAVAGMIILPPFSRFFSTQWMVLPVILGIIAAYYVAGRLFEWIGTGKIERLMKEALVWERAGMVIDVEEAFREAAALLDSYLFSPFSRKRLSEKLMQKQARHYLSKADEDSASRQFISSYLNKYPEDKKTAETWIGRILNHKVLTDNDRDISALIGDTYPDNPLVQMSLVQLCVSEQRTDFHAIETYRRAIRLCGKELDPLILKIADLFLQQGRADELSLKVYLMAFLKSDDKKELLKGLAACVFWVGKNHLTEPWLAKAEKILEHIDAPTRESMRSGFRKEYAPIGETEKIQSEKRKSPSIADIVYMFHLSADRAFQRATAWGRRLKHRVMRAAASKTARTRAKWGLMTGFAFAIGLLVINTALHISGDFKKKEQTEPPVVVESVDPFTLQVAAYLKAEDARRYVQSLKDKGINAYLTQASGAKRKWFQVRVSHFKTKADARAYGDTLKTGKVIEDYYVANYKRP